MKSITNRKITICYQVAGIESNPALVMLHGFGNNSQNWFDLGYVDILKKDFYLIMPDMRGFGLSDKPHEKEMYQSKYIAEDVLAIMANENVKLAHLYGSSAGAFEVGYIATHFEQYFYSFIFQGASPFGVQKLKRSKVNTILARTKDKSINDYIKELEDLFNIEFPKTIQASIRQCDPKALYAATLVDWPDQVNEFPLITKPCLNIVGENEDVLSDMEKATQLIPNCRVDIILEHDHVHAYWAGELVATLMVKFLLGINVK